jgi:hypothetical protein
VLIRHRTQIWQQFSTIVETNDTESTTLAHQGLDPDVKLAYHSNNSSVRHQTEIGQLFSTIVETNFNKKIGINLAKVRSGPNPQICFRRHTLQSGQGVDDQESGAHESCWVTHPKLGGRMRNTVSVGSRISNDCSLPFVAVSLALRADRPHRHGKRSLASVMYPRWDLPLVCPMETPA